MNLKILKENISKWMNKEVFKKEIKKEPIQEMVYFQSPQLSAYCPNSIIAKNVDFKWESFIDSYKGPEYVNDERIDNILTTSENVQPIDANYLSQLLEASFQRQPYEDTNECLENNKSSNRIENAKKLLEKNRYKVYKMKDGVIG